MHRPLSCAALRSLTVLGLGLVLLIAALVPSRAETTPATPFGVPVQGAAPSAFAPQAAAPLQARGPFGKLLSWVADTQQSMQRELATGVKRLKSGNAIGAMLALAGLSFLYGVVHAVGPGHGKAIISSYVVANEETVRRGIMISFIAAALQAVTAILLVSILLIGLNATGLQVNAWANQLESVSYAMIALVGLYLLTTQSVRLWRSYRESSSARAPSGLTRCGLPAPWAVRRSFSCSACSCSSRPWGRPGRSDGSGAEITTIERADRSRSHHRCREDR